MYTSSVKYFGAIIDQIYFAVAFDALHQCFSCLHKYSILGKMEIES
jgi:hypothetical protein